MRDFRRLFVWQKGHELTLKVYQITKAFPREELYGLTSQIRRACASIPANIAEGCGRDSKIELKRFCQIAAGSASELEYHLLLAHDLTYLSHSDFELLITDLTDLKRMLVAYIEKIKTTISSSNI